MHFKLFFTCLGLIVSMHLMAQKGTTQLGLSGNGSFKTTRVWRDGSSFGPLNNINLQARAGAFVYNNAVLGLALRLENYWIPNSSHNLMLTYEIYLQSYLYRSERFGFFVQVAGGLGNRVDKVIFRDGTTIRTSDAIYQIRPGIGPTIFFGPKFSIEIIGQYKVWDFLSKSETSFKETGFDLSIGLRFYILPKN